MKLYHYTTIDTLALILKNRTIRFNRLDKVDDLEEKVVSCGVNLAQYIFASCWTKDAEESIPPVENVCWSYQWYQNCLG